MTHLGNCGQGSLRDAVSIGNRRVVFKLGGEIVLSNPDPALDPACPTPDRTHLDPNIYVKGAFITIDGFTAPSPGITLVGGGLIIRGDVGIHNPTPAHDVIVRGLRIRSVPIDGVQVASGAYNVVLSNLSIWDSGDGLIDITEHAHNVTVAWSILAGAVKATLVKYAAYNVTFLGNLWVGGRNRNPQVSMDDAGTPATETTVDMRNNMVYDWAGGAGTAIHHGAWANVVANFYSSPSSLPSDQEQALIVCRGGATCFDGDPLNIARAFTQGNVSGDFLGIDINGVGTQNVPFPAPLITTAVDACTAAKRVLAGAGARPLDDIDLDFLAPITLPICRRTTTALTSTVNSALYGVPVTFTATVQVKPPAVGTASGSVTFFKGASTVGPPVPLVGGVAEITTATLGLGSTTVVAVYSGDDDFDTSQATLRHKVTGTPTVTALTAVSNPSHLRVPVTLTATVTVAPNSTATPTGTVRFFDGSKLLATTPIVSGVSTSCPTTLSSTPSGCATLVTSTLPAGVRVMSAQFFGDLGLARSTSPNLPLVIEGGTVTSVVSSTKGAETGQPVTFTATVSPVTGSVKPTGTVTFRDGTAVFELELSSGKAVLTTSTLPVGAHTVVASYNGSTDFDPSASRAVSMRIVKAETRTALSATPLSLLLNQFVTFTAVVTRTRAAPGVPDGTVTFKNGGTTLATLNLSGGTAQFRTTLGVGVYTIIGAYSGTASFEASNSQKIRVTVNP